MFTIFCPFKYLFTEGSLYLTGTAILLLVTVTCDSLISEIESESESHHLREGETVVLLG